MRSSLLSLCWITTLPQYFLYLPTLQLFCCQLHQHILKLLVFLLENETEQLVAYEPHHIVLLVVNATTVEVPQGRLTLVILAKISTLQANP